MVLGLPVADFYSFLLLTLAVMVICFGEVRTELRRWTLATVVALSVLILSWLAPDPRVEEGHNVFIPIGVVGEVLENGLPAGAYDKMLAVFNRAYLEGAKSSGPIDWRENRRLKNPKKMNRKTFAASADGIWQRPKYSRIVGSIHFRSQNQAKLDIINSKTFNFYDQSRKAGNKIHRNFDNSSPIARSALPFFVMLEVGPSLIDGEVCWRGELLWEQENEHFAYMNEKTRHCNRLGEKHVTKRLFYLAVDPEAPRDFTVSANLEHRLMVSMKLIVNSLALLLILGLLTKIESPRRLLLPLGAGVSTLLTFYIYWRDLSSGFRTHEGGNDGLTHESFGFEISQALARGDLREALRGGEDIFFFMPGLRYVRAAEDILFGSTSFGVVLFTMFIPIFLFFMLRHFLPLRLCVILIITFMFTPVLERFGFAQFHYVREMWKGFPEPLGYGLFLGALAMTAQLISLTSRVALSRGMLAAWIGVATAGAVALRPNLALAALLLLGMLSLWFIVEQRWKELVFLGTGFAPILLIGFHNWYFGSSFVPLTSSALDPSNLVVPPSTYLEAGRELLHLNFDGSYLSHIVKHLGTWNSLTDVYRLPVLFVAFWVVLRPGYEPALKGLAVITIALHSAVLFYEAAGRKAHLAWLLAFITFVVVARQVWVPRLRERWKALSAEKVEVSTNPWPQSSSDPRRPLDHAVRKAP